MNQNQKGGGKPQVGLAPAAAGRLMMCTNYLCAHMTPPGIKFCVKCGKNNTPALKKRDEEKEKEGKGETRRERGV